MDLFTAANRLLALFKAELESYTVDTGPDGVPLPVPIPFPVPESTYVSAGMIAWDRESLAVYLGVSDQGQPGAPRASNVVDVNALNFYGTLAVQLTRDVAAIPTDAILAGATLPDSDELQRDGYAAFRDAEALRQAAINIKAANSFVSQGVGFVIGQVQPLGPEGGMAAVRIVLSVSL